MDVVAIVALVGALLLGSGGPIALVLAFLLVIVGRTVT